MGVFQAEEGILAIKVNKQQSILQEANLHRNYILKVRLEFLVPKGKVKVYANF